METATTIEARLQDCSGVPSELRMKAESRFVHALARSFPSDQALVQAWEAWHDAAESADMLSDAQVALARTWLKAFDKARQAGFRDIAVEEAYFEVRVH